MTSEREKKPAILKDGIAEKSSGVKSPEILKDGLMERWKIPWNLKDGMMENHPKTEL